MYISCEGNRRTREISSTLYLSIMTIHQSVTAALNFDPQTPLPKAGQWWDGGKVVGVADLAEWHHHIWGSGHEWCLELDIFMGVKGVRSFSLFLKQSTLITSDYQNILLVYALMMMSASHIVRFQGLGKQSDWKKCSSFILKCHTQTAGRASYVTFKGSFPQVKG